LRDGFGDDYVHGREVGSDEIGWLGELGRRHLRPLRLGKLGRNELRPYKGKARRARPFEAQGKRAVPLRTTEELHHQEKRGKVRCADGDKELD
jgi:hypothetical protein